VDEQQTTAEKPQQQSQEQEEKTPAEPTPSGNASPPSSPSTARAASEAIEMPVQRQQQHESLTEDEQHLLSSSPTSTATTDTAASGTYRRSAIYSDSCSEEEFDTYDLRRGTPQRTSSRSSIGSAIMSFQRRQQADGPSEDRGDSPIDLPSSAAESNALPQQQQPSQQSQQSQQTPAAELAAAAAAAGALNFIRIRRTESEKLTPLSRTNTDGTISSEASSPATSVHSFPDTPMRSSLSRRNSKDELALPLGTADHGAAKEEAKKKRRFLTFAFSKKERQQHEERHTEAAIASSNSNSSSQQSLMTTSANGDGARSMKHQSATMRNSIDTGNGGRDRPRSTTFSSDHMQLFRRDSRDRATTITLGGDFLMQTHQRSDDTPKDPFTNVSREIVDTEADYVNDLRLIQEVNE
jgi:hypothetical protein